VRLHGDDYWQGFVKVKNGIKGDKTKKRKTATNKLDHNLAG